MTTWMHQPVGKYVLIEWRAADHGTTMDRIDRGEIKALGIDVAALGSEHVGLVAVFRAGSATQTGPMADNGRLEMLIHIDDIVAVATPVVP